MAPVVAAFPFWLSSASAAFSGSHALFAGGMGYESSTEKYAFSSDVVAAGASFSTGRWGHAGASNTTKAVFSGGDGASVTATSEKYTWASAAFAVGGNLPGAIRNLKASGNSAKIWYNAGQTTGANASRVNTTSEYSYSSDTCGSSTSLGLPARGSHFSFGDATYGWSTGGMNTSAAYIASTARYTYSGGSTTSGTALSTATAEGADCSSPTHGYVMGGGGQGLSVGQKYRYSDQVVTSGMALGGDVASGAAAADTTKAVVITTTSSATRKITFSSDATAAGTSLTSTRLMPAGASSAPGNF